VDIGLSRLVSSAINNSLPSAKSVKELDENIQKYAAGKVSDNDILRVGSSIADQTVRNLDALNQSAKDSPDEFIKRLQDIALKQKKKEEEKEKGLRNIIVNLQSQYERRVQDLEKQHSEINQEFKSKEVSIIEKYKTAEKNLKDSFKDVLTGSINRTTIEGLSEKKKLLEKSIERLIVMKENYDKVANTKANLWLFFVIAFPLVVALILLGIMKWNDFEPIAYGGLIIYYLGIYFYFVFTKKNWSLSKMYEDFKMRFIKKYYDKFGFNTELISELKEELKKADSAIDEYILGK
jgi:hypothetical protein